MEISNILKRTWVPYVEENTSKELTREKDFIGKHQFMSSGVSVTKLWLASYGTCYPPVSLTTLRRSKFRIKRTIFRGVVLFSLVQIC
jgi:hypothetical protein